MFSPTQFGLALLLPAFFVASRSPSLKSGDDSVKAPVALACWAPHKALNATAPAKIVPRPNMLAPLVHVFLETLRHPANKASAGSRCLRRMCITLQHFSLKNTPYLTVK